MEHWNLVLPNFIFNIKYENLIYNTEIEIKNLIKFPKNLPDKKIEKFFLKKKLSGVIKLYKDKYH